MSNPSSVSPSSSNTPGASRGSLNGAELASFASRAISTCRVELEQDSEHDDFLPVTSPPKSFLLKPLPKKNASRAISTCRVELEQDSEHDDFRPATSPKEGPSVLGLHRLGRAHGEEDEDEGSKVDDDASTYGETNRACRQILAKEIPCAPRPLSNRTSSTISSVVQFIGTRVHEAYTEVQTPQNDSGHQNSFGDTDHLTKEVIFPQDNQMKMNNRCLFEGDEQTARSHWSQENSILSKREGDLIEPNILQKAFASEPLSGHPPAFLLVRVHPNKSEQAHDAKPKPAEEVDQNAVAEWWSNLFKFQPGAPSQQARLIRSTHEKLADILLKKDERIESLHAQTIDLERNSKAAMLYSYTIIAELEASRTALRLFGESVLQDLGFAYSELANSAAMQDKCGILEKRLETSERESAAEVARLIEKNLMLEERNRVLEKRTQTSERESAAEIARLNAEIHRLKTLLNQQQQAPKLVGIGMRITTDPPHRVTEIVAGGAAYQSGEIAVGDYILQVGNMDVRHYPIEQILKNILGPAGSYLDLRLDRRDENEESNIFTVTIKRSEIVPTDSAHKASTAPAVADSLRAQLRAKELDIEGLQQKLIVMENKIRELTSNLNDERYRHKLGQSSSSDLAKSMDDIEAKNRMLENRLQTIERESAAEIARLNEQNRVLEEKNCMLEERNRVLEKRTQTSERESAAEIARLNAEIHRFKSLLNQQQQAPKLVGIGMRITNDPPHRVTEIVAGGAAYQSGEIAVGDYILQVGNMDVRHYPIEQILKNILGPAGSYLDLRLDRRDENEESNVFTVTIKRSEIVPTGLAHKALNAPEAFRSPLAPRTIQSIAERTVVGGATESGSSVVQKKRPTSSGFGVFGPSAPGPLF